MKEELLNIPIKYAYIDPGTGSMLFTILIGMISVVAYGIRNIINKLKILPRRNSQNESIPFVIYSDSKRYWNVFKDICNLFEENKIKILYLTQSSDDPVFDCDYRYVEPKFLGEGNKAFSLLNYLKADILLSTTPSLDVFQWKRSKDVKWYIHIPHACKGVTLYRMYGIDYYDALLLNGEFQIKEVRELERLRNLPEKDIQIVGLTYFDDIDKRIQKTEKSENSTKIVLLAPSWGPSSILNRNGEELIDAILDTEYSLIIRPHPQSYVSEMELINMLTKKYPQIEWNKDNDNFDVLNKADILISDYSGAIYDFAFLFDKPVIYTDVDFDDSIYDAHWLSSENWTIATLKKVGRGINQNDFKNIGIIIQECLNSNEYSLNRKKAAEEVWPYRGQSAQKIFEYMISKQKEV
jgi:hypothetical protein